jgi:hypothetical protein
MRSWTFEIGLGLGDEIRYSTSGTTFATTMRNQRMAPPTMHQEQPRPVHQHHLNFGTITGPQHYGCTKNYGVRPMSSFRVVTNFNSRAHTSHFSLRASHYRRLHVFATSALGYFGKGMWAKWLGMIRIRGRSH